MKKASIIILLIVSTFLLNAQIKFEAGYYIDNHNEKTEGLIKNKDWSGVPKNIEFKADEEADAINLSDDQVKEFGVSDMVYKRFKVKYDKSFTQQMSYDYHKEPDYEDRTLWLHLIVDGEIDLYQLGSEDRFYYSVDDSVAVHLVYKEYLKYNSLFENKTYKVQLVELLDNECMSFSDFKDIEFTEKKLRKLFIKYNECHGKLAYVSENRKEKNVFHLHIKAGPRFSDVRYRRFDVYNMDESFPQKAEYAVALALEYVFPFNRNKWSVLLQPTYHQLKTEKNLETSFYQTTDRLELEYQSIEIPLGIRYKVFLNEHSSISVDASVFLLDIMLDAHFEQKELSRTRNMFFSLGYQYRKFGLELFYHTQTELMASYAYHSVKYNAFGAMIRFEIF